MSWEVEVRAKLIPSGAEVYTVLGNLPGEQPHEVAATARAMALESKGSVIWWYASGDEPVDEEDFESVVLSDATTVSRKIVFQVTAA